MKVAISYPPLESEKGVPLLSQNRQFQWFNSPTYIYPMVPAYAATMLKKEGFEVIWDDAIAEGLTYNQWLNRILDWRPDVIAVETKTPVIKRHWEIINELKTHNSKLITVLMGDHVTALPEESMQNSKVDFVLTGGDYDFLLLNLCNQLATRNPQLVTGLDPGIYYRENRQIKNTGPFRLNHDLDSLPMIDRDLTRWKLYAYQNGNYKYLPGTYMMSGRDCWWGRCTFCSWTTLYPGKHYRVRSPERALDEVGYLIENYGVREIMEDSGTLPTGDWLQEFRQGMIERGYNKRVRLDCNMRLNALSQADYNLMAKAGFRFILFGLESGNQETLDRVNKALRVEQIEPGLRMAKKAGLNPHITVMMGYPWETREMAQKTIDLARCLFKKGYVDTLQATIVIPYPGTPLYAYCKENGLLNFEDHDRFDQREQVMKSPLTTQDVKELTQDLYKSFLSPQFVARKILEVRSLNDLKFLYRAAFKVLGHLADFGYKQRNIGN